MFALVILCKVSKRNIVSTLKCLLDFFPKSKMLTLLYQMLSNLFTDFAVLRLVDMDDIGHIFHHV